MQSITHTRIHTSFSVDKPTRTLHTTFYELHRGVEVMGSESWYRNDLSIQLTPTSLLTFGVRMLEETKGNPSVQANTKRAWLWDRSGHREDWAVWPRLRGTGGGAISAEPRPEPASASCPVASPPQSLLLPSSEVKRRGIY